MGVVQPALTAIDLFSGCGGLTLGLKQAGFKVIGAIEIDRLSVQAYKLNHKKVHVWENNIQRVSASEVENKLGINKGQLDLLAGCPPCQGFSTMRTLNGSKSVQDPRNDLLFEFQRFIEALQPKTIMMENVPGLAHDSRFHSFCETMTRLGYLGEYKILNTVNYGVPQRRRRLIYLAKMDTLISFAPQAHTKKTVRDAIDGLPPAGESGDHIHDFPERRTNKIIELIKRIPKNGGSRKDLPIEYHLECHKRCNGFKDVYGRMTWDEPAPTITSGCFNPSKGRFLHPEYNRAITLREAALLQSFPINYKFPNVHNKSAIALLIGNALPPEFIKRHAVEIKKSLLSSLS